MLAVLGVFVLVSAAVLLVLALTSRPVADHPFFAGEETLVIAHRGGRGLWPENTLYAFQQADALGVDVLEMDIHRTVDGVLVTMHDDTVDRTTNGSGEVKALTLAELKALDAGYWWTDDDGATYPFRGAGVTAATLAEVFQTFPETRLNIEIKQVSPNIVADFCQMIRDYGREQSVLVGSFDSGTLEAFRAECPGVATGMTEPEARELYALNVARLGAIYRPRAEAAQLPEYSGETHVVTASFVAAVQSHNMAFHVWTVNETADMERLLATGVDGLITDHPERLLALLNR